MISEIPGYLEDIHIGSHWARYYLVLLGTTRSIQHSIQSLPFKARVPPCQVGKDWWQEEVGQISILVQQFYSEMLVATSSRKFHLVAYRMAHCPFELGPNQVSVPQCDQHPHAQRVCIQTAPEILQVEFQVKTYKLSVPDSHGQLAIPTNNVSSRELKFNLNLSLLVVLQ